MANVAGVYGSLTLGRHFSSSPEGTHAKAAARSLVCVVWWSVGVDPSWSVCVPFEWTWGRRLLSWDRSPPPAAGAAQKQKSPRVPRPAPQSTRKGQGSRRGASSVSPRDGARCGQGLGRGRPRQEDAGAVESTQKPGACVCVNG